MRGKSTVSRSMRRVNFRRRVHAAVAQRERDRVREIGAPGANAALLQRVENARVRMAEEVAPATRDERDARLGGVEQRFRRRASAAVMRDFENVAADVARGQLRFLFALGVTGEECAARLDLQ